MCMCVMGLSDCVLHFTVCFFCTHSCVVKLDVRLNQSNCCILKSTTNTYLIDDFNSVLI